MATVWVSTPICYHNYVLMSTLFTSLHVNNINCLQTIKLCIFICHFGFRSGFLFIGYLLGHWHLLTKSPIYVNIYSLHNHIYFAIMGNLLLEKSVSLFPRTHNGRGCVATIRGSLFRCVSYWGTLFYFMEVKINGTDTMSGMRKRNF